MAMYNAAEDARDNALDKLERAEFWLAEMTDKLTTFAAGAATDSATIKQATELVSALLIYAEQAEDDLQAARRFVNELVYNEARHTEWKPK